MAEWFFDAPAGLKDFRNPGKWHAAMAAEASGIVLDLVGEVVDKSRDAITQAEFDEHAPTLCYVDPVNSPPPADAETVAISPWGAFPRAVVRRGPWTEFRPNDEDPDGRYRAAEHLGDEDHRPGVFIDRDDNVMHLPVRDRQDEYLEWVVRRNGSGKLVKATFVAEGYDYFATLFENDEQRVLELYKEFTGNSSLKIDDLRAPRGAYRRRTDGRLETIAEPGAYNPRNRHNISPGIVHLSHRANSLGAEVNLAGVSGIARRGKDGNMLGAVDAEKLLCCSAGGNPDRNSDPLIGEQAYGLVRDKRRYTLANPVGLYIARVAENKLTLPNGDPVPREWWKVVRGHDLWSDGGSRVLRLEISAPEGETIDLGDLLFDGGALRYGGQLADMLSVSLFVTHWARDDAAHGPIVPCRATCCVQTGTEHTVISPDGACADGFTLRFDDLLPDPAAAAVIGGGPAPPRPTGETTPVRRLR